MRTASGAAATRQEVYDALGRLVWEMDERGYLTHYQYDSQTGDLVQMIQDVDTSQVADEPDGWETPSGGGLHLVTDYQYDDQGRRTQELGPLHTIDIDGVATAIRVPPPRHPGAAAARNEC